MAKQVHVRNPAALKAVPTEAKSPEVPSPPEAPTPARGPREAFVTVSLKLTPAQRGYLARTALDRQEARGWGQADLSEVARECIQESIKHQDG